MKPELREKAIARYRAALASPALADGVRATLHANLAAAHTERTDGERAANLESAIEHLGQALQYEPDEAQRARADLNLSVLWRERIAGDRADNVEHAIEHAHRALAAVTLEADPQRWAEAQMGLGAALLSHPKLTRTRAIEGATHCRLAQRVFTRDAHPQRFEACEQALEAVLAGDPAVRAMETLAARLKERSTAGDPFGKVPDQLLAHRHDPALLPRGDTPSEVMVYLLELFAAKIRDTVAERLGRSAAGDDDFLAVRVVNDCDINAQVATQPPYDVVVSTNLVHFCAEMSGLLTQGLGLSLVDDGAVAAHRVDPAASVDAIADHVRILMDSFLRGEEIPRVPADTGPAHHVFAVVTFFSTMTFVVSHEFGHVIFSEHRRRGETPPFLDYAQPLLEAVFDRLIAGLHHPYDPCGLEARERMDLSKVFRNWAEEIASDIIGASLALEYQSRHGPWAAAPDILAQTKLGIHLALVSQMMLGRYCFQVRGDPLMTATHPPMDFRTFCVLKWLYREDQAAAEKPVADYVTSILARVFAGPKNASP